MQLEELIEQLQRIQAVHKNAAVKVSVPGALPGEDYLVEVLNVDYEHLSSCAVIEV